MRANLPEPSAEYDVVVFGAGINGAAITAELSLRGLKVLNVDRENIASGTSSNSTSLIHGGLRYLEQYDFAMVRKSLDERQSLINLAPYLVRQMPFVLPKHASIERPFWLVRLGLYIYDNLSIKNKLPKSIRIKRDLNPEYFEPLQDKLNDGLLYYDGVTDDSRLTIIKALQAKESGATILTHTQLKKANVIDGVWSLDLDSEQFGAFRVRAKAIVNATGASVKFFAENALKVSLKNDISLVKGSHIILPKLYDGDYAYILQNYDKRVIFLTPFYGHTMLGTTDVYSADTKDPVSISKAEIEYLLQALATYFKVKIKPDDIVSTRSGLRVLLANTNTDAFALSRDYALELSEMPAPILHVIGGKLTIHSQLAEKVAEKLKVFFPNLPKSARLSTYLPGSILKTKNGCMYFSEYQKYAKSKYSWLDSNTLERYLLSYGTKTENILGSCSSTADMGIEFFPGYYQIEIDYLLREEFVHDMHGLLWLNTKLGLIISEASKQKLRYYLSEHKLSAN